MIGEKFCFGKNMLVVPESSECRVKANQKSSRFKRGRREVKVLLKGMVLELSAISAFLRFT